MFVAGSVAEVWDEDHNDSVAFTGWELPDERALVYESWHQMQLAELGLMEALVWWDRADAHALDGARSATAWLQAKLSVSYGHALTLLGRARGLRDCPALRLALADHALTFDQADQLLGVFTPSRVAYMERDVSMLIEHCVSLSVNQCRIVAKNWAERVDAEIASDDPGSTNRPKATVSELRMGTILDGDLIIEGHLSAGDGVVVHAAVEAARRLSQPDTEPDTERDIAADDPTSSIGPKDERTAAQQRADALVLICQFFLDHHNTVTNAASVNRARVNITVDLDKLTAAHHIGRADTPYSVEGLDIESVLQTCCDASVARIVTAGPSLVIDVGRETRTIPPPLRKAVSFRDKTCRFPGCEMPPAFTDVHHIKHWTNGGPTDRDNCCLLCRRHHTMIHTGGWNVVGNPNTTLIFTSPTGHTHHTNPPVLQPPRPRSDIG